MKKLLIIFLMCIIAISTTYILTRKGNTTVNNNLNTNETSDISIDQKGKDFDLYKAFEYIKSISNMSVDVIMLYVDEETGKETKEISEYYKKDNITKVVGKVDGDNVISIKYYDDNKIVGYNKDKNEALRFTPATSLSKDESYYISNISINENIYNHTIRYETLNGKHCAVVDFIIIDNNKLSHTLWFDLDTNLLIEQRFDYNDTIIKYDNFSLNTVTDDMFILPNNVTIKDIDTGF